MKANILFIIAFMCLSMIGGYNIMAQTRTSSPSAGPETDIPDSDIQNLKEKIATKVAELRKDNQKALAGVITAINGNTITIMTTTEEEYEVTRDESLTETYAVSGTGKKDLDYEDLEKDDYIIVTGPVIEKSVTANFIYRDEQFVIRSGKITEVNADDSEFKVVTLTKDNYTVSTVRNTSMQMVDIKTHEPGRITFSKLKEGDEVIFVAKKSSEEVEDDVTSYTADRLVIVPQEYFQTPQEENEEE